MLFGDLGIEFTPDPADRGDPVVVGVVGLRDRIHPGHELRERFELGPLVVGRAHVDIDFNGLFDARHSDTSFSGLPVRYPPPVPVNHRPSLDHS
jgi:hypothetical protein